MSEDGGETFNGFQYGGGTHPDHHALWIDPTNPQHLLLGTDGGVYRSYDRGLSWSKFRNLSLAQFYHVSYDFEEPYNVFGGLQDNGSWMVPHRIPGGAIQNKNWEPTGWGDGFWVIRDRSDANILYFESQGGNAVRRHIATNETKPIKPYEQPGEAKLRWNWSTPLTQSPTNPRRIYICTRPQITVIHGIAFRETLPPTILRSIIPKAAAALRQTTPAQKITALLLPLPNRPWMRK
jgi:hypothetical protein